MCGLIQNRLFLILKALKCIFQYYNCQTIVVNVNVSCSWLKNFTRIIKTSISTIPDSKNFKMNGQIQCRLFLILKTSKCLCQYQLSMSVVPGWKSFTRIIKIQFRLFLILKTSKYKCNVNFSGARNLKMIEKN